MSRVLVIEDDRKTAAEISAAIEDGGAEAVTVGSGREGLLSATIEPFDAIVLDRMLPGGLDGLGVLQTLRAAGVKTPVLILSAMSSVDERVRGLRSGGDDYLAKPFDALELTARLAVLMRPRPIREPEVELRVGDLVLDLLTHTAQRAGRELDLLEREYRLLEYLARHVGQTATRSMLLEQVWNYRLDHNTNVIDVHIGRIRRKLEEHGPPMIQTVRGNDFVLRAAG